MKLITFQHLSITGLAIAIVSTFTATVLPKSNPRQLHGLLEITTNGVELTWVNGFSANCTYTMTVPGNFGNYGAYSRTTSIYGSVWYSSSITSFWSNKAISLISMGEHTSHDAS